MVLPRWGSGSGFGDGVGVLCQPGGGSAMSPECSSPEMPVPSGDPRPALPLSPPGGAGSGKPREAEPGRDFPGTAAGARRPGWGWDGGKPGVLGAPGGRAERRRQWENRSQGKGTERSRDVKFLCSGCPSHGRVLGSPVPLGRPSGHLGMGMLGRSGLERVAVLEGRRDSKTQRWRLHPFFPAGGEVPYSLCCQWVLPHPAALSLWPLSPACPGAGLACCQRADPCPKGAVSSSTALGLRAEGNCREGETANSGRGSLRAHSWINSS